jgi:hypothetical protein
MRKNYKYFTLVILLFFGGMFSSEEVVAQTMGTCCKTNSGAICIAGPFSLPDQYYAIGSSCIPLEDCWVGDPECEGDIEQD